MTTGRDVGTEQRHLRGQGWFSSDDPLHAFDHEAGHAIHYRDNPSRFFEGQDQFNRWSRVGDVGTAVEEVSRYAATNVPEFVAEVFRLDGWRASGSWPRSCRFTNSTEGHCATTAIPSCVTCRQLHRADKTGNFATRSPTATASRNRSCSLANTTTRRRSPATTASNLSRSRGAARSR